MVATVPSADRDFFRPDREGGDEGKGVDNDGGSEKGWLRMSMGRTCGTGTLKLVRGEAVMMIAR